MTLVPKISVRTLYTLKQFFCEYHINLKIAKQRKHRKQIIEIRSDKYTNSSPKVCGCFMNNFEVDKKILKTQNVF